MSDPRIERPDFNVMLQNRRGIAYNVLRGTSYTHFVYWLCFLTTTAQLRWATFGIRLSFASQWKQLHYPI